MSRREVVANAVKERAAAVQRGLDVPPRKRTPKQLAALETNTASLVKYSLELAGLPADEGETPAPPNSEPTPPTSGTAAARSKAWDKRIATDYISGTLQRLAANGIDDDDVEGQVAALGPGLTGQALCLGVFGPPDGDYASRVDWSLAEPWGGYWKVSSGFDERGNWAQAWNASQKAGDIVIDPVSPPNAQDVGRANGLNAEIDGPA